MGHGNLSRVVGKKITARHMCMIEWCCGAMDVVMLRLKGICSRPIFQNLGEPLLEEFHLNSWIPSPGLTF